MRKRDLKLCIRTMATFISMLEDKVGGLQDDLDSFDEQHQDGRDSKILQAFKNGYEKGFKEGGTALKA